MSLNTFGERLVAARRAVDLGQSELAEAIGVHAKTVSRWENNKQPAEQLHIEQLAHVLLVDAAWLRDGVVQLNFNEDVEPVREPAPVFRYDPRRRNIPPASLREVLPRPLRLMALDFEREALEAGADENFLRYARQSLHSPELVAMFEGGYDDKPLSADEQKLEMEATIDALRAILKMRLARRREASR